MGFPGDVSGKEPICQCRRCKRLEFNPWVWKIPWRSTQQPTPVFLPGESQGQRTLEGYSPWGHKESHMTEVIQHEHNTMSKLKNSVQRFNNKHDQGKEKKKRTKKLEERSVEQRNKKRMKRIQKAVGTMHTIKRNNVLNGVTGEKK